MIQDNQTKATLKENRWGRLLWTTKLVITGLILAYIVDTFRSEQKGLRDIGQSLRQVWNSKHFVSISFLLLLVPVNWALESLKWRNLVNKILPMTFRDAFKGTLTGLAVGVALPAQLGDTIGRLGAIQTGQRLQALGAAIISNGIQFYVSIVAGTIGWAVVSPQLPLSMGQKNGIWIVLAVIITLGVLTAIARHRLLLLTKKIPLLKKTTEYLKVIGLYSPMELLWASTLGGARYLVFLTQFLIALSLFQFQLPIYLLASCITLIFLVKTVVPAVNVLGDLGIREFTALFVFKSFNLPIDQLLAATFLIWVVNVLGPIFIGLYLIWKYKIKSNSLNT
ncbi:lysylphosphatidylglycerol synthase-like protein [Dyadobacter jejuensis]|uniref:Lysylphosphatidylglycerol synthase-like protein n=1 Tax=Dyadobacter jejuensis TaxID=1082580 RepID=A0A316AMR5_9BACT|nr:lysylphosphatidylglycerol synthase domain-containing protein [Dyadobacter jejuensis]PWJ59065.1 lysylphosphatidylglycerol synthase-like protein [Dyadobacter jejuensis]